MSAIKACEVRTDIVTHHDGRQEAVAVCLTHDTTCYRPTRKAAEYVLAEICEDSEWDCPAWCTVTGPHDIHVDEQEILLVDSFGIPAVKVVRGRGAGDETICLQVPAKSGPPVVLDFGLADAAAVRDALTFQLGRVA